jgi:hypothetical protein
MYDPVAESRKPAILEYWGGNQRAEIRVLRSRCHPQIIPNRWYNNKDILIDFSKKLDVLINLEWNALYFAYPHFKQFVLQNEKIMGDILDWLADFHEIGVGKTMELIQEINDKLNILHDKLHRCFKAVLNIRMDIGQAPDFYYMSCLEQIDYICNIFLNADDTELSANKDIIEQGLLHHFRQLDQIEQVFKSFYNEPFYPDYRNRIVILKKHIFYLCSYINRL